MTKEEFYTNVKQATETVCELNSDELHFITEMLYDPNETWTFNDFCDLAHTIGNECGDVIYALGEYDKCPDLTDPENLELICDWLRDHKQAYMDCLVYVRKNK